MHALPTGSDSFIIRENTWKTIIPEMQGRWWAFRGKSACIHLKRRNVGGGLIKCLYIGHTDFSFTRWVFLSLYCCISWFTFAKASYRWDWGRDLSAHNYFRWAPSAPVADAIIGMVPNTAWGILPPVSEGEKNRISEHLIVIKKEESS